MEVSGSLFTHTHIRTQLLARWWDDSCGRYYSGNSAVRTFGQVQQGSRTGHRNTVREYLWTWRGDKQSRGTQGYLSAL